MTFSLSIALRVSPFLNSKHIYFKSKYVLVETCFKSLITALNGIDYELFVILDGCPDHFQKIFEEHVEKNRLKITKTNGIGNSATFLLQIFLLSNIASSEYVYFAEDDYFYIGHLKQMLEFIRRKSFVDFLSPYDHPDYYFRKDLHPYRIPILKYGDRVWKNVMSTTCTFLTKKRLLEEVDELLKSYVKIGDYLMWYILTRKISAINIFKIITYNQRNIPREVFLLHYLLKTFNRRSYNLWVPEPTIATHMQKGCLSPGIDWNLYFRKYSEETV